jgi:hypothetical protein
MRRPASNDGRSSIWIGSLRISPRFRKFLIQIKARSIAIWFGLARLEDFEGSGRTAMTDISSTRYRFGVDGDDPARSGANIRAWWNDAFLRLPLAVAGETLRFTARRLQAQADYLSRVNHCANIPEFMEAQSQFMRKATDDYGVETGRLIEEVRAAVAQKAA